MGDPTPTNLLQQNRKGDPSPPPYSRRENEYPNPPPHINRDEDPSPPPPHCQIGWGTPPPRGDHGQPPRANMEGDPQSRNQTLITRTQPAQQHTPAVTGERTPTTPHNRGGAVIPPPFPTTGSLKPTTPPRQMEGQPTTTFPLRGDPRPPSHTCGRRNTNLTTTHQHGKVGPQRATPLFQREGGETQTPSPNFNRGEPNTPPYFHGGGDVATPAAHLNITEGVNAAHHPHTHMGGPNITISPQQRKGGQLTATILHGNCEGSQPHQRTPT